ncbi:MAG: Uma2 family endonuclease, partial [Opitutaceae bacterium]
MLTVKHRPLTVHDYMQLPEDSGKKTELIEGDFFMSPSPNRFHQEILNRLLVPIWAYLQAKPIGKVYA